MARVRSFAKSEQHVKAHPTDVDCEYAIVDSNRGPLLHLSTFGSDDRASGRKSSQSLQLDRQLAQELVAIIEATFPGIRRR